MVFSSLDEVVLAHELGYVHLHAKIKVHTDTYYDDTEGRQMQENHEVRSAILETTPGRVIFNLALPEGVRFVNRLLDKGGVNDFDRQCSPCH